MVKTGSKFACGEVCLKKLLSHIVTDRIKRGKHNLKPVYGKQNPFFGKKHSEETKEKNRKAHLGKTSPFKGKPKPWLQGEKSPFWKGGITPINFKIRNSIQYKEWRERVFKRDNYTCIWCGVKSTKGKIVILNADHIKPFCLFPGLRFSISNGRTLCKDCHKTTDTYQMKLLTNDPKTGQFKRKTYGL